MSILIFTLLFQYLIVLLFDFFITLLPTFIVISFLIFISFSLHHQTFYFQPIHRRLNFFTFVLFSLRLSHIAFICVTMFWKLILFIISFFLLNLIINLCFSLNYLYQSCIWQLFSHVLMFNFIAS
jgi:hypothetical protein